MNVNVFKIPDANLPGLVEKLEKMVARKRRVGTTLNPPKYEVIHTQDEPVKGKEGEFSRFHFVEVQGERPKVKGWEFIATIDHTGEANILRAVPGMGEIPVSYRTAEPLCDHCNIRRNRNETFLLRHEQSGRIQQVGRNCLSDFFDGYNPEDVATMAEWLINAGEMAEASEGEGGGNYTPRYAPENILSITYSLIEMFGWMSRGKARDLYDVRATADRIGDVLAKRNQYNSEFQDKVADQMDKDREKAESIIADALIWARSLDMTVVEDYLYNLAVVSRMESVSYKEFGLLCSLLPAYKRHLGEIAPKEEPKEASAHVGTVGKRTVFQNCKLTYIGEPRYTQFGPSTLLIFKMNDKDVIKWFSTNTDGFEKDQTYDIVGTVKSHGEFKGVKDTLINRVSIADTKDAKRYQIA